MRDMKLKNKIIVGIAILLVFSFVPEISLFTGLWNVSRDLDRLYDEAWTVSACAMDVRDKLSLSYHTLGSSLMSRNKSISAFNMESLLDDDRRMRDAVYSLDVYAHDDVYSDAIEALKSSVEDWRTNRDEIAAVLCDEDYAAAHSLYAGELSRSTDAASEAAEYVAKVADAAASSFVSQGKLRRRIAMSVALGLGVLKIAVAAFIIVKLVKAVARPVKSIKAAVELMSRGTDIMEHIKYDTKDDFIAVADLCKHLVEQLKGFIADIE